MPPEWDEGNIIITKNERLTVLVVGATGSVGVQVLAQALKTGHRNRAHIRASCRTRGLDVRAESVIGQLDVR